MSIFDSLMPSRDKVSENIQPEIFVMAVMTRPGKLPLIVSSPRFSTAPGNEAELAGKVIEVAQDIKTELLHGLIEANDAIKPDPAA